MDPERKGSPHSFDEEEEGGGPVKSFLEHLEDLRWTLIKSIITVLLAMLVCAIASNYIIAILKWPLSHSLFGKKAPAPKVFIHLGSNHIGVVSAAMLGVTNLSTNAVASASIVPIRIGTNIILGLQLDSEPMIPRDEPVLKAMGPVGPVMVALRLALYGGLILAAPFVIFFVGQFVLPALHVHEKKILYQASAFGIGLFISGVLFAYFIVTGVALLASVDIATWMGFVADEWRAEEYIGFVTIFLLGMGICFEIPVVILLLVKIGLLDYRKLSSFRSFAIVINLVIGAVITPSGDPFTMLLFAAPLQFLYELSVVIAWFWYSQDQKKAMALQNTLDI